MLALLVFAGFLLSVAGPLWLVMGRIHNRAKAARVSGTVALVLSFTGYFVGVLLMLFTGGALISAYYPKPNSGVVIAMFCIGSAVGATFGGSVGYIYIWARTAHNPDYEDASSMIEDAPRPPDLDDDHAQRRREFD